MFSFGHSNIKRCTVQPMYFKVCLDSISVHSLHNNMNTNVKTVCGVLTANSEFKIYTVLMLIYSLGRQLSYKHQQL